MKPKLNYVVLERVKELIPKWLPVTHEDFAENLDSIFTRYLQKEGKKFNMTPDCWVEFNVGNNTLEVREKNHPGDVEIANNLLLIDNYNPIIGSKSQILIPLYAFFMSDKEMLGQHAIYIHGIITDVPLYYVGITKQNWYARLNQHIASARGGSPYLFHRALREHQDKVMGHRILGFGYSYDGIMAAEEKFVDKFSLYPLGLNMIPGGFAGFKYLGSLGYQVNSDKQRHNALMEIVKLSDLKGRPNPLCAARWASDQDYINRVICGHAGRLTVEQVRIIRTLSGFSKDITYISEAINVLNLRQINGVIKNKFYSRVS